MTRTSLLVIIYLSINCNGKEHGVKQADRRTDRQTISQTERHKHSEIQIEGNPKLLQNLSCRFRILHNKVIIGKLVTVSLYLIEQGHRVHPVSSDTIFVFHLPTLRPK